jgi:hypothetical protein
VELLLVLLLRLLPALLVSRVQQGFHESVAHCRRLCDLSPPGFEIKLKLSFNFFSLDVVIPAFQCGPKAFD